MKLLDTVLTLLLQLAASRVPATTVSKPNIVVEVASEEAATAIVNHINIVDPTAKAVITAATPLAIDAIVKAIGKAVK